MAVHLPIEEHLGCFQVVIIIKKTVINIVCRFLCEYKFLIHLSKQQGVLLLIPIIREALILSHCLLQWLHDFTFSPVINESYCYLIFSPAFDNMNVWIQAKEVYTNVSLLL